MVPLLILAALAVVCRLLWSILTNFRHTQNARKWHCGAIPTYPGDILGINTLKEVLRADKEKLIPTVPVRRVETLSAREGRYVTTFRFRQVGRESIFTSDPKNMQAILATQFKDFELGHTRRQALLPLLGSGIFTADGEAWSRSRSLLRPQFTRDQISDLDLEERHVQKAMAGMPVDPSTKWTPEIDIQAIFFRLTIDSATEFLFGESVESQTAALSGGRIIEDKFPSYFDRGQWYATQRARFEKLYWMVNNKESRETDDFVHAYVDRFVDAALAAAREGKINSEKSSSEPYVFLHGLTAVTQDPVELRSQLLNILLAGRDTTASLLSWCVLLLARHPDMFQKLRKTILTDFGSYEKPRNITFASLKSCRYLHYFMNEVLRLYPIVPGNRRIATKDTTLPRGGGPDGSEPVYVRKGQPVVYSVFVTHRRKDIWGADADVFNPDRWEDLKVGWEYLPFNGGPRICIGQQFALTEAGYVLVRLLQRFDQIVDTKPERDIRFNTSLTSAPWENVVVRMREGA
ncbi:cytochrome P450 [Aspergillus bertholletiae]|uniref:Cytochrome P450 n=1 Tax=Aspergillus bertholletiae TaxID=1226010 RepID=A0A5N7AMP9_9EURO|nr:cytochrome P450 [Aspergillus bertholletiae]